MNAVSAGDIYLQPKVATPNRSVSLRNAILVWLSSRMARLGYWKCPFADTE